MKAHRTDGLSLTFGLLFLACALWWALSRVVNVHLPALGWLVAGALIFFGALGLMGAIRSGRREEIPAAVPVETPGDLPPRVHAEIVRELLENPADRTDLMTERKQESERGE